ncbi:MAG TPA: hypothetical protein VFA27_07140 [Vicinamibacterales bacterium]|nr:hypothetical protein [Vicinamibacterales bacterium]
MLKGVVAVVAALCCAAIASAADTPAIKTVSISKTDATLIYVIFDPRPDPTSLSAWTVTAFAHSAPSPLPVKTAVPDNRYASTGRFNVTLATSVPAGALIGVEVHLAGDHGEAVLSYGSPSAPTPKPRLEPVESADDATLYFKGVVSPSPSVSIDNVDARGAYVWRPWTTVDVLPTLTYKHDSSDDKDPDVLSAKISLTHYGHRNGPGWILDLPVVDSDAQAKTVNAGVGVRGVYSRHFDHRAKAVDSGATVLTWAFDPEVSVGLETGNNFKNDYAKTVGQNGGSGGYVRFVPRIAAYLFVPVRGPVQKILVAAEYEDRLLARGEIRLETRDLPDGADPTVLLDKAHRSHTTVSGTFMVTDWFGFDLEYERGSLPPAFKFVDNKMSVSLVFMAAQP